MLKCFFGFHDYKPAQQREAVETTPEFTRRYLINSYLCTRCYRVQHKIVAEMTNFHPKPQEAPGGPL